MVFPLTDPHTNCHHEKPQIFKERFSSNLILTVACWNGVLFCKDLSRPVEVIGIVLYWPTKAMMARNKWQTFLYLIWFRNFVLLFPSALYFVLLLEKKLICDGLTFGGNEHVGLHVQIAFQHYVIKLQHWTSTLKFHLYWRWKMVQTLGLNTCTCTLE